METMILEQLAQLVLSKELLECFMIVKLETDEANIDAMSMIIHLDERINKAYQENSEYESLGFMEAVSVTDFPIRDHKVVLKLRRRRWKNSSIEKRPILTQKQSAPKTKPEAPFQCRIIRVLTPLYRQFNKSSIYALKSNVKRLFIAYLRRIQAVYTPLPLPPMNDRQRRR